MADKEKALYRKGPRGFEPANDYGEEFYRSCKLGEMVELKGSRPRNIVFHDLWWVLLRDAAKHTSPPMTARQLHEVAKTGTGINKVIKVVSPKTGEPVWVTIPGETNFAAMDQVEFKRWTREAATFLCEHFLPGVVPDEFLRDIEALAV